MNLRILVADDDQLYRMGMQNYLSPYGEVTEASSKEQVESLLETQNFDLAFIDIDFNQRRDGLKIIPKCSEKGIYTIVFSCNDDDETVGLAYQNGCKSFFSKGEEAKCIKEIVSKYIANNNQNKIQDFLREKFITSSRFIKDQIVEATKLISNIDISIIIQGPTGVGKSTLAKYLHDLSNLDGEFVEINCSEINPNLLESELFGHKKGAFTGAIGNKTGRLLKAHNGTLFIDEICSMPFDTQTKLLKVLEERSFYPVGSDELVTSNFKIICAGQKHLVNEVENGNFRADLYYRLSGFTIFLPAIKERLDDILLVLNKFLEGPKKILFSEDAKEVLLGHTWPGNIREIKKLADFIKTKGIGFVQVENLPKFLQSTVQDDSNKSIVLDDVKKVGLKSYIKQIEREILEKSLEENNQSIRPTLRDLKISFSKYYALKDENKSL